MLGKIISPNYIILGALEKISTLMSEYRIPLKYRKMENLHIVFWLLKDIGWCLIWKPLGIVMIFPTLIIALVIAWRTREMAAELYHNLAIAFWISANSYWMCMEFLELDEVKAIGNVTYKQLTLVPFLLGLSCLLYYYLIYSTRRKDRPDMVFADEQTEVKEA